MQNDKLEEQVQKIALDFFLNGIEPPVSISKKESQSLNNSSPNISSSQSSLENKEFKVPKSKFDKASSKASSRQTTEYDKKMESSLSARRNEMNNKSTSSAKKTASLSLEESSQLDMNTFRSFKQKTSHFINIEAGEVDESARQQFGEIFSQQSFGSPAFSSSIMDMNFVLQRLQIADFVSELYTFNELQKNGHNQCRESIEEVSFRCREAPKENQD